MKKVPNPDVALVTYRYLLSYYAFTNSRFITKPLEWRWPSYETKMQYMKPYSELDNNQMLHRLAAYKKRVDGYQVDHDEAAQAMLDAIHAHIKMMDGIYDRLMNWHSPCEPCTGKLCLGLLAGLVAVVAIVVGIITMVSSPVEPEVSYSNDSLIM